MAENSHQDKDSVKQEEESPKKRKLQETSGYVYGGSILTGIGIGFATNLLIPGVLIGIGVALLIVGILRHKLSD